MRSTNLSSRQDDLGKLPVVQHSVASDVLRGQRNPFGGGSIKDGLTHAPTQERLDRLEGLVGGAGCAALPDGRNDFNHISLSEFMDAAARPRCNLPPKEPGNLGDRAIP